MVLGWIMEFKSWFMEGDRELASMYKAKLSGVRQDLEHHQREMYWPIVG